jgi:hypothetical protein
MQIHRLTQNEWMKAIGVGLATSIILSAIMVPVFAAGIAPMPEQPSLAFAEAIFGRTLPLPVGLLFHVVYVTFWSAAYVALFRDDLSFMRALWLALALWIVALVVFFPISGWGFLGLGISPKLIVAALVPHLLFAGILWGLCRAVFRSAEVTSR